MATKSKTLKEIIKELNELVTKDHINQFIEKYYKFIVSSDNNIDGQSLGETILKGGNDLKMGFGKLPIYFIIAHSAYDINMSDTLEPILPDDLHSNFFKMPISEDLSKNKFLIYNTPVGTFGLVSTSTQCINPNELLSATDILIKETLFNPKIKFQNKLGNYKRRQCSTGRKRNGICHPKDGLSSSFYLPGSTVIEKNHYFYGNKLFGTGLGIIRINDYGYPTRSPISRYNNTGYTLLKNSTNIPSCFYLSNTKLTDNDKLLRDIFHSKLKTIKVLKYPKLLKWVILEYIYH